MPIQRGPFDAYLQPQQQPEVPQATGWEHPAGSIANIANSFLSGVRRAKIEKFQREEGERERQQAAYSHVLDQIGKSNLTDEAKQRFSAPLLQGLISQVAGTETVPVQKGGNPIANFMRETAIGMTGGQMPKRGAPLDHAPLMEALAGMSAPEHTIDYALQQAHVGAEPELRKFNELITNKQPFYEGDIATNQGIMNLVNAYSKYGRDLPPSVKLLFQSARKPLNEKEQREADFWKDLRGSQPGQTNQQQAPPQSQDGQVYPSIMGMQIPGQQVPPQATQGVPAAPAQGVSAAPTQAPPLNNGLESLPSLESVGINPTQLTAMRGLGFAKDNRNYLYNGKVYAGNEVNAPNFRGIVVGDRVLPIGTPEAGPVSAPRPLRPGENLVAFENKIIPDYDGPVSGFVDKTTGKVVSVYGANPRNLQKKTITHPDKSTDEVFVDAGLAPVDQRFKSNKASQPPTGRTQSPPIPPVSPIQQVSAAKVASKPATTVPDKPKTSAAFDINNPISIVVNPKSIGQSKAAPSAYDGDDEGLKRSALSFYDGGHSIDQLNELFPNPKDRTSIQKTVEANGGILVDKGVRDSFEKFSLANNSLIPLMAEFAEVYNPKASPIVVNNLGEYIIKGNPKAQTLARRLAGFTSLGAPLVGERYKVSDADVRRVVGLLTSAEATQEENRRAVREFGDLIWKNASGNLKSRSVPENQARRIFKNNGLTWRGYGDKPEDPKAATPGGVAPLAPDGFLRPGSGAKKLKPI